jgi:hypothetical protein
MTREAPRFPEALLSIRLPSKPLGKRGFNYSFRFSVWAAVWIGSQEPLKGGA